MADPLSITTGVVALLTTCLKTGAAVKEFYNGAAIAGLRVKGLLSDVESFAQALQMMRETLEQENVQLSLHSTGHIGNHCSNLSISIQDGQNTLIQLQITLDKVNKSVSILDGARKHLRLQAAAQEITMLQQQIRSYRDTIQLSLQTVILWNQVTFKDSADKILPNLDEMHDSIRRIAFDINTHMTTLQTLVESKTKDEHIQSLSNLRKCVQSAASVVSSTSTTLGVESADYFSEFGDCFPDEPSETMLRWISSNSVSGSEESRLVATTSKRRRNPYGKMMPQLDEASENDGFDSDEDLEVEIVQSLLRRGKKKLHAKDFVGAERLLRNCLLRTSDGSLASVQQTSKSEIMMLLLQTYRQQGKWTEAQSLLSEKIAMGSRESAAEEVLSDMLSLVEVLLEKKAYAEALLYGRQALKGYRRLGEPGIQGVGESLRHLVKICHADGNVDEEEAYAAILADFMDQQSTILNQDVSYSNAGDLRHDVEYAPNSHPLSERPYNNLGETSQQLASVRARKLPAALPVSFVLPGSHLSDATSTPDTGLPILRRRNEQIVPNSGIIYDTGSMPNSHSPSSELVIQAQPHDQYGFRLSMPVSTSLPALNSEAAETPRLSSFQTLSMTSEEIYELEGDQSAEMAPYVSTPDRAPTQAQSQPSNRGEFLAHQLRSNLDTRINHNDYVEPSSSSVKASTPLFQDLSRDGGSSSILSGEADGGYDPFKYPAAPPSTLPKSSKISSSGLNLFSTIEGTSFLPSSAPQAFSQASVPSASGSSTSRLNLSDAAPAPPPKRDTVPQGLIRSPMHPSPKNPVESQGRPGGWAPGGWQKLPVTNGLANVTNITGMDEKQLLYSNSITPVNSLSDAGVATSVRPTIKLVIVGDGNCGKSSLLIRFSKGKFPEQCPASNFGVYQGTVKLLEYNYSPMTLDLWDTPGNDDCDHLRSVRYPQAQVILICFNVGDPASLDRVLNKWHGEVLKYCRGPPRLLVGMKTDLRHDGPTTEKLALHGRRPVTSAEAESVRCRIGALHFRQCSALTGAGMREVFDCAARLAMSARKKKSKRRSLLSLIGK